MSGGFIATQWRKSTRSAQGGADCVEVAKLSSARHDLATIDHAVARPETNDISDAG
ncbi:DUF397 domain-containing protein [Actinoallomurus vinaceus]|uniref:DUF397 domain-containing protein n=1 Tax=Actinoallomurus vinaceus TaxID=1080074 RepID=UPI003CD0C21A